MAIYTYGIVMNGGKLIAQSADATNGSSYGIGSHGDIIINGGTVTATAGTASQESYGLEISSVSGAEGKISLSSNAIVDASGVTAASNKKPEGYIDEIGTTFKHYGQQSRMEQIAVMFREVRTQYISIQVIHLQALKKFW